MHYANQTLFITIATMLWAADIRAELGKDGTPIKPAAFERVDKGVVVLVTFLS